MLIFLQKLEKPLYTACSYKAHGTKLQYFRKYTVYKLEIQASSLQDVGMALRKDFTKIY